jgi:hypothetical protein
MIITTKLINKLLVNEVDLQKNQQKDNFISKCFKVINKHFIKHFKSNYLFHKVYFIENEGVFKTLGFAEIEGLQNSAVKIFIHLAEETAKISGNTPFTEILLEKHLQGLLLFTQKEPNKIENVITQNLKSLNCSKELAGKLHVKEDKIKAILDQYQFLSASIKKPLYVYFIRPFAKHRHYNGVFLLILTRPLTEQEFIEISYLWTKILSETALIKAENQARAEEQELIFEEYHHIWNTEIATVVQNLDIATKELYKFHPEEKIIDISRSVNSALYKIQELRMINAFNLLLMKCKGLQNWSEIDYIKSHIADKNIFKELTITEVSVKSLFLECSESIIAQLKSLAYIDEDLIQKKLNCLINLIEKVKRGKDYKIHTIKIGLKIILLDLLKNSLMHAEDKRPIIDFKCGIENGFLNIHFINNSKLSVEAYNYINNDVILPFSSLKSKGGIRTIKRIISSKLMTVSGQSWKLVAAESSLTVKTNIAIQIPFQT